ncbi:MAG: hypothetical protein MUC83_01980 [Pirellula sp.]|jgi:hypothetical protein|nr:hypothetical protein [Pirellula sp.]
MSTFQKDPERLNAAIDRMRSAIKILPVATVPICGAICASPFKIFGLEGLMAGFSVGAITGLFAATILGSIMECLMLLLVELDRKK